MADLSLKIPASSANLGLGFDSIGVAVNKFLYIDANLADTFEVTFKDFSLSVLPSDESNLVFKTARSIAKRYGKDLPPMHIEMQSEILYLTVSVRHPVQSLPVLNWLIIFWL